ncbi:MAG: hypothetical protein E7487_05970 [Ruminococcaceae bacterium]|nr:hypothetical protein [Oscillospiraceae bacterium]
MFYLNIDGFYGLGAYEEPEYRTLSDLLTQMNRLGIHVSVTAQAEGRDLSALFGNRKLMRDIAETPGAKGRILPCFAIAPALAFAEDEYTYLLDHLKSGEVNFVRVYPKTYRHPLYQIERILSEISPYRPVVLLDAGELNTTDYQDLITLSEKFPYLSFIITKAGWWFYTHLSDLLWRRPNILADISLFHFRSAIELTVKHFGKERAVFGLGGVSHNGAAMAALRYAKIDDSDRAAIAGENILRLMPNQKLADELRTNASHLESRIANSYWKPFMDGKGVQNTLIIDAHTHIGPMARGWFMPDAEIATHVAKLEEEMKLFGISKIVSTPEPALFGHPIEGCELVEREIAGKEDRFRGYLPFNPFYEQDITDEFIDRKLNGGYYIGFKAIPEYWRVPIDSPKFDRVWKYAEAHHLPTLIHTWEGNEGNAARCATVAAKHPGAFFIFGHSGGGTAGREQAIEAAIRYPNVYLEFCGSFTARQKWEDTLKRVDPKRVLFGTDTYPHDIAWELGRLLSCDIDDATLRLILGENMQRLLAMRI